MFAPKMAHAEIYLTLFCNGISNCTTLNLKL